jgi:hypothetical protein
MKQEVHRRHLLLCMEGRREGGPNIVDVFLKDAF